LKFLNQTWHVGVASAIGPVARKLLLGGFVAGYLFLHNSQPLLELSKGRETWLTMNLGAPTLRTRSALSYYMLQELCKLL
jgi:hypothetical protein